MTPIPARPVAIIEDDKSVRTSLVRLLRSAGRSVVAYASAEEFLARDSKDWPCCLLVNIHLSGMSGLDLLEKLARDNVIIPVVFITSAADAFGEQFLQQAGVPRLCKPFDETTLIRAIDSALGKAAAGSVD